jgi:hypothetical protein
MIIIINSTRVKEFGSNSENVWEYAQSLMAKGNSVWVINRKTAVRLGFL